MSFRIQVRFTFVEGLKLKVYLTPGHVYCAV